jgi:hypothetical protein
MEFWLLFFEKMNISFVPHRMQGNDNIFEYQGLPPERPTFVNAKNAHEQFHRAYALCFLYLACRHLRLPIFPNDFERWIKSGQLSFMDPLKDLPDYLESYIFANKLSNRYWFSDIRSAPNETVLKRMFHSMEDWFVLNYGYNRPELNPVLFWERLIQELELPGYIYL